MENYIICNCKHVTYADVENALTVNRNLKMSRKLLKMFRKSQNVQQDAEGVMVK